MNSGQDKFLVSGFHQLMGLGHNRLRITAARQSARPGNDAEGTEVVAAILNLHKSPRPVGKARHIQLLEFPCLHNVADSVHRLAGFLNILHMGHNLLAVLVADHEINTRNIKNLTGRGLRIAARYGHNRLRIAAHGTADHLAAFFIAGIGYCTCVDQIDVGGPFEINLLVTFIFEKLPDGFSVIEIHFTT
ncbi:hypothetical protein D3C81_1387940 [compost metagenome]